MCALVLSGLVCCGYGLAAQSRSRSTGAWFEIGLLTGVFGLFAVLVTERVPAQSE